MMRLYPNLLASEPECIYDNSETISEGLRAKISRLEEEIAQLEATIKMKDVQLAACVCGFFGQASSQVPTSSHLAPDQRPEAMPPPNNGQQIPPSLSSSPEPQILPVDQIEPTGSALCLGIWPLNIPPRELLHHLVETVFHCVPLASRLIHRASFMTSLQQPSSSDDFPHVSLLHASCALASLYTPIVVDINPASLSEQRDLGAAATVSGGIVNHGFRWSRQRYFPRSLEDIVAEEEHDFASSHIKWCHSSFRAALQRGDALLQIMQACCFCA
ncbi:hypothetical protein FRB95_007404 [Tulasnella sp. JGI-2019a]|nr:hypothetical protein FRB95_007404 [Tulasnella sp. JGI-2019a]